MNKNFLGYDPKKKGIKKHFVEAENKTNNKFKGKVLLIKQDAGYFYYVIYGKKQGGCGYITEYSYNEDLKQFICSGLTYNSIYEIVTKNSTK